jgi:O-antigen/teichoic acid export membrane protein
LAGHSLTYALGALAYKGIALVTVPVLARLLAPDELGLLDVGAVVATIVAILAAIGTEQAVAWLQPQVDDEHRLWGATLAIVGFGSLALTIVAVVARDPLAALLTASSSHAPVVLAATVYGGVMAFTAVGLNVIRLRGTPRRYAIASFLVVASEMAVGLVIAWQVASPVVAMLLGWAVASGLVALGMFRVNLPTPALPSKALVERLVRFGAPLVPAAIAWVLGDMGVRAAIARGADLSILGEYGIAFRIATVVAILVTGFTVAWQPYLYRSSSTAVMPRARRAAPALLAMLGAVAIGLTLMGQEIVRIVAGPAYLGAVNAVPGLAASMVALGLFQLAATVRAATAGTRTVAIAALVGAGAQIVIAFALVERLSLVGASLASMLGYVAAAAMLTGMTRLVSRSRDGAMLVAIVLLIAAGMAVSSGLMWAGLEVRLLAVAVAGFVGIGGLAAARRVPTGVIA